MKKAFTIAHIYVIIYVAIEKGGAMDMPIKRDDGLNAVQRYQAKCDCITIRPMKADGEKIRASASAEGISTTQYILKAIAFYENSKNEEIKHEDSKDA